MNPASPSFPFPAISLDPSVTDVAGKLESLLDQQSGWKYGLGCKIFPLDSEPPLAIDEAGASVEAVDCSGELRWLVFHLTGGRDVFPDGSAAQHEFCDKVGFKKSLPLDLTLSGGVLRAAFLTPQSQRDGIGHALLAINGATYESHGSAGPSSRSCASLGFLDHLLVYVLSV